MWVDIQNMKYTAARPCKLKYLKALVEKKLEKVDVLWLERRNVFQVKSNICLWFPCKSDRRLHCGTKVRKTLCDARMRTLGDNFLFRIFDVVATH